jgi:hypothetical protein
VLSKAYFYKAKALKKIGNLSDSALYFEQVVRAAEADNHLASCALYEIAKIKIQLKDFYEAYYNLKSVIFLMKRKTKAGLKLISSLADRFSKENNPNDKN